jgi:hypothetical protein
MSTTAFLQGGPPCSPSPAELKGFRVATGAVPEPCAEATILATGRHLCGMCPCEELREHVTDLIVSNSRDGGAGDAMTAPLVTARQPDRLLLLMGAVLQSAQDSKLPCLH